MGLYFKYIECLDKLINAFEDSKLDFIKYKFVYGSVSKPLISESSDIDLLLVGDEPKTMNLVNNINSILESYIGYDIEIDVKYYSIDEFLSLKDSNLFLISIEKDCKELGVVKNELLRFC